MRVARSGGVWRRLVARARPDILAAMRLPCTCIALFTLACSLACQGAAPADKPADVKPMPATPATPSKPVPAPDPAASAPIKVRAPVNPTEVTPGGKVRPETVEGLKMSVPTEWTRKPGANPMRLAEFVLPGPGGEVTLVVSRFAGGGGDAAANVARWKTQMTRPDGSPVDDAHEKTSERAPLKVTTVDIQGTNVAAVTPGAPERYNEPDSRLLGVIVEGAGDPYFFKAVGPAKTVDIWEPAVRALADSLAAG